MKNTKLKLFRVAVGLNQKQVEQKTGINTSKISYFESGYAIPNDKEIKKLAKVYKRTPDQILETVAMAVRFETN